MRLLGDRHERDTGFDLLATWAAAHPRPPYDPQPEDDPFQPHREPPPGLVWEFFSHYRPFPARLLADLQLFPHAGDRHDILATYASSSSEADSDGIARAIPLLQAAADSASDQPGLTPADRKTIADAIRADLQRHLASLFPSQDEIIPPEQIRARLGQTLHDLDSFLPFIDPADQSLLRGDLAKAFILTSPAFAWEATAPGADFDPLLSGLLIRQMIQTAPDHAIPAFSAASAAQSDMIAQAFTIGADIDPSTVENPAAAGLYFTPEPMIPPGLADPIARALFDAALARGDAARAAQWLDRITSPAARAEAAKKLFTQ